MSPTTIVFMVIAFTAVAWNIVSTIAVAEHLRKKGHRVNYLLIKALSPVYAYRYKKFTLEETGKVGPLFYHWLISINVALVTGVLAIVSLQR